MLAVLGEKRKASPLWEISSFFVTNAMYGGVVVHLAVDVSIAIIIILLGFVSLVVLILRSGEKSTLLLLNRDLSIQRRGQLRERDFLNT